MGNDRWLEALYGVCKWLAHAKAGLRQVWKPVGGLLSGQIALRPTPMKAVIQAELWAPSAVPGDSVVPQRYHQGNHH